MEILQRRFIIPYCVFWIALAMVYQALFVLDPTRTLGEAVYAGLAIIGSAFLLGLVVLATAIRVPLPQDRLPLNFLIHVTGALVYSLCWIAVVALIRNVDLFLNGEGFQLRFPSTYSVRWHLMAGPAIYAAIVSAIVAIRSVERLERLRQSADLRALRAQLNPHFLFNSLHTIMMLFRTDKEKAELALEGFSDLIRYSLPDESLQDSDGSAIVVPVKREMEVAEKYLDLQHLRLGDRIKVNTEIDTDCLHCLCPQLLLQPLLENAIVHGGGADRAQVHITLEISRQGQRVHLALENSVAEKSSSTTTFGIGLKAVAARLSDAFQGRASMVAGYQDHRFRVNIDFPVIE